MIFQHLVSQIKLFCLAFKNLLKQNSKTVMMEFLTQLIFSYWSQIEISIDFTFYKVLISWQVLISLQSSK